MAQRVEDGGSARHIHDLHPGRISAPRHHSATRSILQRPVKVGRHYLALPVLSLISTTMPETTRDTQTWPDLAIGLYDKLTGRGAEITYEFQSLEISVP